MITVALAVLGLCLGSFVNALVWRLRTKKDWVKKRSVCTHCGHVLSAIDLIPVFSWLMLRGKCRYCREPITAQYPLVELLTALLFVVSYSFWPAKIEGLEVLLFGFWLVVVTGFIALAVYDLRWFLLPNKIIYPLIGLAFVQVLLRTLDKGAYVLTDALWGVIVGAGVFYLLFQISGGKWIGGGDVKLGVIIGLLVGGALQAFMVIFIASLLGTLFAVPLLLIKKLKKSSQVPFGPFLIGATIIVYLFGSDLIRFYERLLLSSV